MKTIDKLSKIDADINNLVEEVKNSSAEIDVESIKSKISSLKAEKNSLMEDSHMSTQKNDYLSTNRAVKDFVGIIKNSNSDDEVMNSWTKNLQKNGVTIDDDENILPRKMLKAIQTKLTDANPVFNYFSVTHTGAIMVARDLKSTDEAFVHHPGEEKPVQNATLKVSKVDPVMIGKIQTFDEIQRRGIDTFDEIYTLVVQELVQAVINKIVDLALVEGTATEAGNGDKENGFVSVLSEKDTDKVAHFDGTSGLSSALEEASYSITQSGRKALIVTPAQRKAIIDDLRKQAKQTFLVASDATLKDAFGIDDVVIYRGTKAIQPTIMVQGAYAVDMDDLTKVEAFEWKYNSNVILIETLTTGRVSSFGGVAVVDTDKK